MRKNKQRPRAVDLKMKTALLTAACMVALTMTMLHT